MAPSIDELMPKVPEQEDDDLEPNPTLREEIDDDSVRRELQKHERLLQCLKKRHSSDLVANAAQQEVVAQYQAELLLLQAKADATHGEVQEFSATIATLFTRQAAMAADRAKLQDSAGSQ